MWRIASLFWLLAGFGVHDVVQGRGIRWDIWASTPDIPEANSDANVYIILIDNNGKQSPPIYLNDWLWNDFERNSLDHFIVHDQVDIMDVCAIRLYRDDTGPLLNWFLEKMSMIRGRLKNDRNFECNCWVPTEEEEKKLNQTIERSPPCSAGYLQ